MRTKQIAKLEQEISKLKEELRLANETLWQLEQAAKAFLEIELRRGAPPEDVLKIFRGLHQHGDES